MTSLASVEAVPVRVTANPPEAVQVFALALMVLPADYVVRVVGADGYAAALVAYLMFAMWLSAALMGYHRPFDYHYPVRNTLVWMWVVTLASYVLINREFLTGVQTAAANRWLMQLVGISGIVLVTAEFLPTIEDIRRVLRVLTWGGAFCGIVAALQFRFNTDLTKYLKLPGFAVDLPVSATAAIVQRGSENRVPGTATDPIELGVSAAMLLVLAVYLMMHDKYRPTWQRVIPVLLISLAIAASVSRSAVIAVVIAVGGLIISLPPARRLKGLAAIPLALVAFFVIAPGLLGTLIRYFSNWNTDPSIAHRTSNYSYVFQLIRQAPWLGTGGGTDVVAFGVNILDNEYLTTAIELGLLGLLALSFYLVLPAVAALVARRRTTDPELRDLCATLAAAELAAVICSGTFDGLSFPMFYSLQALIAGLIGAAWLIINRQKNTVQGYQNGEI
jgi:O-antigen ligase